MARPRSVPEEVAVERALLAFWEHGYDRTSIADLSEAIGVGPSSIYNTFETKEALYQRALGRYVETYAAPTMELLNSDGGEDVVEFTREVMRGLVRLYTTEGQPRGCAIFQSGGAGSPEDSNACALTQGLKHVVESSLRRRFESFSRRGAKLSVPPRTLAQFVVSVLCGISQLASDGASRKDLFKVVEHTARSCVVNAV